MVKRRKHGYLEALRENHIPIDRELVVCDKIDYQVALKETEEMLRCDNRPDAILAFNDIITFAAFTAIKNCNLRIPEDVALIGFTDDQHAAYVTLGCQPSRTSLSRWVLRPVNYCYATLMAMKRCIKLLCPNNWSLEIHQPNDNIKL